jgi:hypothetical protein
MRIIMFIALACMAWAVHADVPHIFQPGQPARAADVNQNFKHLSDKTDDSIREMVIFRVDGEPDPGAPSVAVAVCPSGSVPVSANCFCQGDGTTMNFGVMMACMTTSEGAAGGCAPDAILYNPSLSWSEPHVHAMCVAGQRHDGTLLAEPMGMDIKIHADDHGETVNRLQEQITTYRTLINQ